MFQNVLVSQDPIKEQVISKYINKLNYIADRIVVNINFGVGGKVDRLAGIKIKNLLPALRFNDQDTKSLNTFQTALNRK